MSIIPTGTGSTLEYTIYVLIRLSIGNDHDVCFMNNSLVELVGVFMNKVGVVGKVSSVPTPTVGVCVTMNMHGSRKVNKNNVMLTDITEPSGGG